MRAWDIECQGLSASVASLQGAEYGGYVDWFLEESSLSASLFQREAADPATLDVLHFVSKIRTWASHK